MSRVPRARRRKGEWLLRRCAAEPVHGGEALAFPVPAFACQDTIAAYLLHHYMPYGITGT